LTEVRVGQAYVAKAVKTGRSKNGPYEIVIVQSPGKAQPKIGISVTNVPSGIGPNGVFQLRSIRSVMHRKYKKNGKWVEGSVTVKGKIKPLVQLTPRELEKLQKINYEQVETTFPSLEDYFA
jgi:hypothetical protein